MSKNLKDIIGETYYPKNKDEQDFWAKHKVELFQNMYADAKYDPMFTGSKVSVTPREGDHRHGYDGARSPSNPMDKPPEGNDEKHYEEVDVAEAHSKKQAQQAAVAHAAEYDDNRKQLDNLAQDETNPNKRMMGGGARMDRQKAKLALRQKRVSKAADIARKMGGVSKEEVEDIE